MHRKPWFVTGVVLCLVLSASCSFGQGRVLLKDNFNNKTLERWTIIDTEGSKPESKWVIGGGHLAQIANTSANDPKSSGTYAIGGDASWTDYTLSLMLSSDDNDGIGVMFRYTDLDNYYRFRWTGEGANWDGKVLEKCVAGKWQSLATDKVGYKPYRQYLVGVVLEGPRIRLYVDDTSKPVFDVVDSQDPLTSGKVGLYSWDNAGSNFARLCVATNDYPFPPTETKIPPLRVTGVAFDDSNSNGTRDTGERGLAGVRVSDGYSIVRTRGDGSYTIESVDRARSKFVFVTTPSGRRASGGFYRALPEADKELTADFALAPCPESAKRSFTFAQITDIHVTRDPRGLVEDLAEIAAFKPSFIVATGDLVNDGRQIDQLEAFKAGASKSAVPAVTVVGNHDGGGDPTNYEELFGPDYYSFDYGGCHFVIHNSCDSASTQRRWLEADLREAGGAPILFFQHYQPSTELMQTLARRNTLGIFSGHWHTTKVFPYARGTKPPILYVNAPPLSFGGIDVSPRGFVLARVDKGKLKIEHRFGGVKRHFAIAFPADGSTVADGPISIGLAAYDSSCPSVKVDYRIDGGAWGSAKSSGLMSWSATERLGPGAHTLTARCDFGDGTPAEKRVGFTVSSGQMTEPRRGESWPTLQHDAARSGVTGDTVSPPLRLAWSTCLGGSAHGAAPVVVGDTAYVGLADEGCTGRAGVYALDIRTGAKRWEHHTRGSVRNAVAVNGETVYALSVAGEVVALDAANGKVVFDYAMSGVNRWLFSSPVVKDGVLYVGSGAEMLALDARTGARIWTAEEMGGDWISCLTSPAVGSGLVYMGFNWGNGLYALNRRTGKSVWNNKDGYGTTHATPTIVEGRIYHAANNKLHCADAATGAGIWTADLPGTWTISSPVVSGDRVFVGGPDGNMRCFDAATGNPRWSTSADGPILCFTPYGRSGNPFIASPAVSGETVYCPSGDGKLYAYEANDGKVLWSYDLGVPITSSAAISGNAVYVTTFDGMVCAFVQDQVKGN